MDAWAIDFALTRGHEALLRPAYHYRDPRNDAAFRAARSPEFDAFVFARTGIQFISLNTLYQLLADQAQDPEFLASADRLLLVPDWFHYLLCGRAVTEETNASTTQLYDPRRRAWSEEVITRFGFPRRLFTEIVPPGTVLGPLLPEVAAATGLAPVPVIAGCTHDTAAAVAAVPAQGEDRAYLSAGTWSLIGVELAAPLINDAARRANFTNEAGYGGTIRFLKNIIGLWLLQECRRIWARDGHDLDYATLTQLAEAAPSFRSLIHPDAARFHAPPDMPAAIRAYCRETAQPEPQSPGEFARGIFESLALLYRARLDELESLTGRTVLVGPGRGHRARQRPLASARARPFTRPPRRAPRDPRVLRRRPPRTACDCRLESGPRSLLATPRLTISHHRSN